MKAAVLRGVGDLRLEELPDPKPKANEVLIRVRASGVCGTDVHMWEGKNNEGTFPFIPGHEWSGEVLEVGKEIRSIKVGDKVVGEPFIPCGVCPNCRDGMAGVMCIQPEYYGFTWDTPGGFAEYVCTKEARLHVVPKSVGFEEAALIEPASVAYHGSWGGGGSVAPHDRVVVFGAGPIGLLSMLECQASGARVIVVEPIPYRRDMARKLGADVAIDPTPGYKEQIMDETGGRGATLVLECSGSDAALADSIDIVGKQARIVLVGQSVGRKVPIEIGMAIWKATTIYGSCDSPFFFPKTLDFMGRRLVDLTQVVTHRFPLDRIHEAFELGKNASASGKIIIEP
jgi:L-iditol 2-dehydrogenase